MMVGHYVSGHFMHKTDIKPHLRRYLLLIYCYFLCRQKVAKELGLAATGLANISVA